MDEIATRAEPAASDPAFAFGRERRMHARVYAHWRALLRGRAMPARDEFDAAPLGPAADHAVLIELTPGGGPALRTIGGALRRQSGIAPDAAAPPELVAGSLLGRLLHHLPAIVAAGAPLGFEAEQGAADALPARHRGVLLPLAGADGRLAAVYGVVSWATEARLDDRADIAAAIEAALAVAPLPPPSSPWATRPRAAISPAPAAQQLAAAQTWAALAASGRALGAAPLHAAIGATYDLLLGGGADDAPAHVFGAGWTRRDRATVAAVLRHARRLGLGPGALAPLLDRLPAGHLQLARGERDARRRERHPAIAPAPSADPPPIRLMAVDPDFLRLTGHRSPRPTAEGSRRAA